MAEPANRKTNTAGGKYYVHPVTEERFDSVTTALDVIGKAALKIWAGMVAADMAFDLLPQMSVSLLEPVCGNTNNRCYQKHGRAATCERCPCGRCEPCIWRRIAWRHSAESSRRAQEGTELHEAVQLWVTTGGTVPSVRPEVLPYWTQFLRFVEDYGLTPKSWHASEITMINREHMYAGTSDAVIEFVRGMTRLADEVCDLFGPFCNRVLVRIDWKTREKGDERLYDDMPLQMVAYDRCTVGMLPNGEEYVLPMSELSAILQLRPESYSFKPAVTDDLTFATFLRSLEIYRWIGGEGKRAFDLEAVRESIQARQSSAVRVIADVFDAQPVDEDGNIVVELPEQPLGDLLGEVLGLAEQVVTQHFDAPTFDDPWSATTEAPPDADPPWDLEPAETVTVPNVDYNDPTWPGGSTQPAGSLADLKAHGGANPAKPPAKKTAKRAPAKKSATAKADPFALAQTGSATLASLQDFDPGRPDPSALGDEIPF